MKVLLLGGLGSIGSRYSAILRYLKVPFDIYDIRQDDGRNYDDYDFTHAIIATPTNNHFWYIQRLVEEKKTFLCEKPLCKNLEHIAPFLDYTKGYVVNNYAFMFDEFKRDSCKIVYNYYKTGQDGLAFDCCQLLLLDYQAALLTTSPVWLVENNGAEFTYRNVEESYIDMIRTFLGIHDNYKPEHLWGMPEGYEMTRRAIKRST